MLSYNDKISLIKKSLFFRDFPEIILTHLASALSESYVAKGETIIHKGEYGDTMFLISHGKMKVHDGDKVIAELNPTEIFGELAALSPEIRIASVTALENTLLLKINNDILYNLIAQHITGAKGIIEFVCNRARSISKLQEQMIQQEKFASLGLMSSGISHELKNPLNFIINFSQLTREILNELTVELHSTISTSASQKLHDLEDNINKIIHYCKRADSVVNKLLQHAQQSGLKPDNVVLSTLIHQALLQVNRDFQKMDANFIVDITLICDPHLPAIHAFPTDLLRVFFNIINNAYSAMQEKQKKTPNYTPELEIKVFESNSTIEIIIKDNGGGIKSDDMSKLFHPFFTTKLMGSGLGLGLYIAHAIITQQHDGKISITSDHTTYTQVSISFKKERLLEK